MGAGMRRGTGWGVGGTEEEGKQHCESNAGGPGRDKLQISTTMSTVQLG